MLRCLYLWLIRLHPRRFRKRFGDEMLSIFDEAQGKHAGARLLGDGALSVVRQWTTRFEFGELPLAATCVGSSDGTPNFYTVDDSLPHSRALIHGTFLSLFVGSIISFAMIYDQNHVVLKPLFSTPFDFSASGSLPKRNTVQREVTPKHQFEEQPAPQPRTLQKAPTNPPALRPVPPKRPASPDQIRKEESLALKPTPSTSVPTRHGTTRYAGTWTPVDVPRRVLRLYEGTYIADAQIGLKLSIKLEFDALNLEVPGESKRTLLPISETEFIVKDAPDGWVEFSKSRDGTAQLDFYGNERHMSARRLPDGRSSN